MMSVITKNILNVSGHISLRRYVLTQLAKPAIVYMGYNTVMFGFAAVIINARVA